MRIALLAALLLAAPPAPAQTAPHAEFITLGTGGGPLIRSKRSEPANAVVVNGAVYLFDVGDGVQRQMLGANLHLADVRAIFISHHHIDHNADLGPLVINRWLFNNYTPLPVIGPPGTKAMIAGIAAGFRATELSPITIGGPAKPAIAATAAPQDLASDMDEPTIVYQDNNIRVLAITNDHYHFTPGSEEARLARSYAYRIEAGERIFVFSGDTGPSAHLELLAKDADVLVSEVIDLAAMERALGRAGDIPPQALGPLLAHMEQDHLTPQAVAELASKASVKQLVLTHLAPGLDDELDTLGYTRGISDIYHGPVTVANDLARF